MNPFESPPVMAEFADRPLPAKPEVRRFPWVALVFLLVLPGLWFGAAFFFRATNGDRSNAVVGIMTVATAFWFWPCVAACYSLARYIIG